MYFYHTKREKSGKIIPGVIRKAVEKIRSGARKNIWLVGGSELVTYFLNHRLIDKITLSTIPVLLGSGIPLFTKIQGEISLQLMESKSYETGVINATYSIKY